MMDWMLTEEEGQAAVDSYIHEDFSVNVIRLGRGHWEDIVPVVAKCQARKIVEHIEKIGFVDPFGHMCIAPGVWQQLCEEVGSK
jgi:hypothetical protein